MKGGGEGAESEAGGMQSSRMQRRQEWEDIEAAMLEVRGRWSRGVKRTRVNVINCWVGEVVFLHLMFPVMIVNTCLLQSPLQ